ncbi:hypothetical protein [Sphingomonas colocasiae]|uniref:Resolvase HTH domain-containing protein n=1 Tax=Sphingomonas colocasiae TaxID=1848973 RepID=A0ABS7PZN4_9SPHN|nr:hypothetical protein [Sphingomonas colocasiae]MBY8826110.1 hypothetical protein [Sphingomonas colocasiae]
MADWDFDLLGDPIPEGLGRRGRPPHIATDQNRSKVMLLLAQGWPNWRIARAMGITDKTLAKYYFRQLAVRDGALDKVKAGHLALLWEQAKAGNVSALKEIGKTIDRLDAAMFGAAGSDQADDSEDEADQDVALRASRMGKKAMAAEAAKTAGQDSDWGDDLLPGTRH